MRRAGHRGHVGGDAQRRGSHDADFPVRPGLFRDPLDSVVAVLNIGGEGLVHALGVTFAAGVLVDIGVARIDVLLRGHWLARIVLYVRSAEQNGGERAGA